MLDAVPIWPVDHSLTNFMPVPPGVAPSLDFETRSACDLKSAGADRYAQDVSTEVLCAAIKVGPAEEIWVPGMPFPRLLQETAIDQGLPIRAWNAAFEIAIWMHVMETDHGWPALPPERFACTMQRAALVGCPGALDRAVTALALDVSKDMDGHKLMLKMCKPRNVRKGETPPPPGQHLWHEDPDDMLALQRYCMDDTRAEAKALESLPEPNPLETEIIRVDRQINRRGLLVDTHAARGAMAISEVEKKRINEHVKRLTNGEISTTNQVAKILAFVQARGVNIDTLRAQDVRGALMDADEQSEATSGDLDLSTEQIVAYGDMDPTAKELLSARAEMAKASTAKFRALTRSVSFDGRLRDLFAYSAAYRTQRWAGRKFQMHNLPRLNPPHVEEDEPIDPVQEDRWFETLASGRYDDFAALLPADWSVMDGLKASLRGTVMAEHAHRITVADLAQIEARSLPWMAGQHDVIAAFERLDAAVARNAPKDEIKKLDIYSVTGTKMNSDRQAGKIATLACLGADTQVLVKRDACVTSIPIVSVKDTDMVWDGQEWVTTRGCVSRGRRMTARWNGVSVTADHSILCGKIWSEARTVAEDRNMTCLALETASGNLPSEVSSWASVAGSTQSGSHVRAERPSTKSGPTTFLRERARDACAVLWSKLRGLAPKNTTATPILFPIWNTVAACLTESRPASIDVTEGRIPAAITVRAGYTSGSRGEKIEDRFWNTLCRSTDGMIRGLKWIASTTRKVTRRAISGSFPENRTSTIAAACRTCKQESLNWNERIETYDLGYCGPRNRYTILTDAGPLIVHNCGYGGGWHTFVLFALGYGLVFSEHQARDIVSSWRAANPMIVEFWTAEEWAAKQAIRNPGIVYSRGHTGAYVFKGGNLLRQLPSGRCLVYRRAGIERLPTPWGQMKDTITYEGNSYAKGQPGVFVRLRTYGGKLAQNANQAICRDILGVGLVRAAHAGLKCVLHVHDEQGVISPIASAAEHGEVLVRAMTDPIRWLPGLPITSSADILRRYAKT